MALTTITIQRLNLDTASIMERRSRKIAYKEPWFISLATEAKPSGEQGQ